MEDNKLMPTGHESAPAEPTLKQLLAQRAGFELAGMLTPPCLNEAIARAEEAEKLNAAEDPLRREYADDLQDGSNILMPGRT